MPGPSSTTSIKPGARRTVTGVPGVWARTLASRFAKTWRMRASSTFAMSVSGASSLTGRSGSAAVASATASRARAARSVGTGFRDASRSRRASSRRSVTRSFIRPGLALDAAHRVGQLVRPEGTVPVELRVALDGGQRRPQLVGRVRRELADPRLGPAPRPERLLDPLQHHVDRGGEPGGLGALSGAGHAGAQVAACGDGVRGGGHPVQWQQAAADQPPTEHDEDGEQQRRRRNLRQHQVPHGRMDLAERGRHDDDAVPPRTGHGAQAGGERFEAAGTGGQLVRTELLDRGHGAFGVRVVAAEHPRPSVLADRQHHELRRRHPCSGRPGRSSRATARSRVAWSCSSTRCIRYPFRTSALTRPMIASPAVVTASRPRATGR